MLRGRSSRGAGTSSAQGIPLQFNYRATTNQVSLAFQQSLYTQYSGRDRHLLHFNSLMCVKTAKVLDDLT